LTKKSIPTPFKQSIKDIGTDSLLVKSAVPPYLLTYS